MVAMSADSSVPRTSSMRSSSLIVGTTGRPAIVSGEACQGRYLAHPLPDGLGRPAAQVGTSGHLFRYDGKRGYLRAFTDPEVVMHAHTRCRNHKILDDDAARNPS